MSEIEKSEDGTGVFEFQILLFCLRLVIVVVVCGVWKMVFFIDHRRKINKRE
jgi:hypothetical protein